MIHITMRKMKDDFSRFRGFFNCPSCNGIIWFFSKESAPGHCDYCNYELTKLFGLVNGLDLAKRRYYFYGEESCLKRQRLV